MSSIGLDASYVFGVNPTGIAGYSRRLIESLAALPAAHRFFLCYRLSRWRQRRHFLRPAVAGGSRISVRLYQQPLTFWLPWEMDLFHSLAQRPPAFSFKHEVVTIHDVFPITGPNYSTSEFQRKFSRLLRESLARSERMLVLSEYTARQLVRHCAVDRARIRVVPGGVDFPTETLSPEACLVERERLVGKGCEMLLTLGVLDNRKNVVTALRVLELLPERYKLVLAGGDGYGAEAIHAYIAGQKLESRVRRLGHVPSGRIPVLYQSASALLFPSLEEGFGFPLLEAMAYGLPVVTSNTSALPEVGGDAALYADPRDPCDIASKISLAVEDPELRQGLIRRGRQRARQFPWRKTAEETLRVYQECLAG
jgi:glycosyltransferase involved in cell wall biosynthesis